MAKYRIAEKPEGFVIQKWVLFCWRTISWDGKITYFPTEAAAERDGIGAIQEMKELEKSREYEI